ncbi:MAG: peptidylprolyl isomerase [Oscillospiraceae bacterium]|nr:peptidylprolyl isomerase [Oscillospiraceae bacterium]
MSASSKKKLRKAQEAEKLTEKQLKEQKEAKQLKIYSTLFVVVLALVVVAAVWIGVSKTVENSGVRERSTTAVTIGEHELSNAELNYFYIDAINKFYSDYGSYATMFGLDTTLPLNEQVVNEETGLTWADDFLNSAKENAKAVYALADEAKAQGYTLTEDELAAIDSDLASLELYANLYGYTDAQTYLKAMYGKGATMENYRAYAELTTLAGSYQAYYANSLVYDDADLREAEKDNYAEYSSFSYNSYYLSASRFLEGGTTGDDGNTTYSDAETAASVSAAEEAANILAGGEYESVADFDAAIAALEINAETENAASTAYEDHAYAKINSVIQEWVTDENRQIGDVASIPSVTHSHEEGEEHSDDEDASEHETINGYYVVYFNGSNDNTFALANVRHILVAFEHDHNESEEHDHSEQTYTDAEKAAAKNAADELLAQWKAGDATEESFAALANENSDDGDGTTGGLYEDVYPGQMVPSFNDWCFDESRKTGDTEVIESEYGYHVMYYVSDSDTNYRDYQIRNALVTEATNSWFNALLENMTITDGNTAYISKDLVLTAA